MGCHNSMSRRLSYGITGDPRLANHAEQGTPGVRPCCGNAHFRHLGRDGRGSRALHGRTPGRVRCFHKHLLAAPDPPRQSSWTAGSLDGFEAHGIRWETSPWLPGIGRPFNAAMDLNPSQSAGRSNRSRADCLVPSKDSVGTAPRTRTSLHHPQIRRQAFRTRDRLAGLVPVPPRSTPAVNRSIH